MMRDKRRRLKLWQRNPHCHWCGRKTVYIQRRQGGPKVAYSDDEATLDHLNSRLSGNRKQTNTVTTVLACRACNHRRAAFEEATLPAEELRRRSVAYPARCANYWGA